MKVYKKIMDIVTVIENIVLTLSMILVTALTFGNVVARKVFHHSWGFTEEIVIAVLKDTYKLDGKCTLPEYQLTK